jgi:hypothetical protein
LVDYSLAAAIASDVAIRRVVRPRVVASFVVATAFDDRSDLGGGNGTCLLVACCSLLSVCWLGESALLLAVRRQASS